MNTKTTQLQRAATVVTQRAEGTPGLWENRLHAMTRGRGCKSYLVYDKKRLRLSASTKGKPKDEVHCAYLLSVERQDL